MFRNQGLKQYDEKKLCLFGEFETSSELEGCIGFGLPWDPRDPTQISRERAVLPLLWAGVGSGKKKIEGDPRGTVGFGM